ncbi:hypothetical protein K435DRAFT_384159 [Dendrothele bispora CBS 962.96]|uniref:Uncharacterized protein n=1 Tax=Dendrothele bispora (strain CBS 962.96) TaxID=1314807 RepID=A0A4S8LAR2_DENBC|nr:hypothetical protein K435DRAFT_384159 [Dendrothele bispora CBS 962.96]
MNVCTPYTHLYLISAHALLFFLARCITSTRRNQLSDPRPGCSIRTESALDSGEATIIDVHRHRSLFIKEH